ncbi:MAG: CDP-alcohol phosphatidyltransferase family protein [Acidobacteria bacterium]|nr:CDP-alcohol phosphatidyltransferase family protein [Acidobacteriota bacterium]MCH8986062.1 CDP-alcohol phosphatidyltransferase family protein [Acidobacteriota bacterium]
MLDLKGRSRVAPLLDPIAKALSWAKLTPTAVTVAGLLASIGGAILVARQDWTIGAVIIAVGTFLDALDGPLARLQGTASTKGAFIDTMSDRFGELAVWAGLIFSLRTNDLALMLAVFSLGFSLLIPYVRAKAESWDAEGRGGWMGRAERMILLVGGIFAAGFDLDVDVMLPMLWIMMVLTGVTVGQRIRNTWAQLPE